MRRGDLKKIDVAFEPLCFYSPGMLTLLNGDGGRIGRWSLAVVSKHTTLPVNDDGEDETMPYYDDPSGIRWCLDTVDGCSKSADVWAS